MSLFLLTSGLGVYLSIFSSSCFSVWVGLELNLLSFIPLLSFQHKEGAEVALKYFLIQVCGSFLLLVAGVSLKSGCVGQVASIIILFSMVLKMGGAPFHFCCPILAEGMSWVSFFLASSLQKTGPLVIMFYSASESELSVLMTVALCCGVVGAAGGVNEFYLRKLLSYSSISHLGCVYLSMSKSSLGWVFYFFLYCIVLGSLLGPLYKLSVYHLNQLSSVKISKKTTASIVLSLLSLGGLPPLLGFLPKWFVIQEAASSILSGVVIALTSMSVVTLFFYSRCSLNLMVLANQFYKAGVKVKVAQWSFVTNILGSGLFSVACISFLR